MNLIKNIWTILLLVVVVSACDEDDSPEIKIPAEVKTINDLAANPQPPGPPGPIDFTFFSFEDESVVNDSDSATSKWDIGLSGTTIIVNSGASGPGSAQAQIISGLFDEITTAPENNYVSDSENGYAIPTGSGNGWYTYNLNGNNIINPIPGKVIMMKTNNDKYVKFEIISYYKGNPDTTTPEFINFATRPEGRYYTIKYALQTDGSRDF